jgi:hypothetical protein
MFKWKSSQRTGLEIALEKSMVQRWGRDITFTQTIVLKAIGML